MIGSYKILKVMDSAPGHVVYKCRHVTTGDLVSCRAEKISNIKDNNFFSHFRNELIIHSHINHPGIANLLDILLDNENLYTFFEYCEDGNLHDIIASSGGLSEQKCKHYFAQLIETIEYLHSKKIAHRDIKLENIQLTADDRIKLSDFCLSKFQVNGNLMLTTCGTLIYAAPEIIKEEPYDGLKADIWSAGIVLYSMIFNQFPWEMNEKLPAEKQAHDVANQIINGQIEFPGCITYELSNLLSYMLSADPDMRPTAEDILRHPWLELNDFTVDDLDPDLSLESRVTTALNTIENTIAI